MPQYCGYLWLVVGGGWVGFRWLPPAMRVCLWPIEWGFKGQLVN